jgi:hypothetical protein
MGVIDRSAAKGKKNQAPNGQCPGLLVLLGVWFLELGFWSFPFSNN